MNLCHFWPKVWSVTRGVAGGEAGKSQTPPKPITWLGESRQRLRGFPEPVREDIGTALFWAQRGEKHSDAKPLRGFGGAGVLEIVENHDGDTYRAVYTVRFRERLYVLHCFQKKSKKGDGTPKRDLDLIQKRLKRAQELEDREYK